jgi:hypothetical protein
VRISRRVGRSNERFAGLMEKIRFPSGYLLFEIWKSEAKKRERRRRRKHDGREKRGKSRDGRKQTRGLRWVFRWILCSVRSCWTICVECVVCCAVVRKDRTQESSPHVGGGHSRCTLRAGGSGSPVSDDAMPIYPPPNSQSAPSFFSFCPPHLQ